MVGKLLHWPKGGSPVPETLTKEEHGDRKNQKEVLNRNHFTKSLLMLAHQ
jgi:hypothetical protein